MNSSSGQHRANQWLSELQSAQTVTGGVAHRQSHWLRSGKSEI